MCGLYALACAEAAHAATPGVETRYRCTLPDGDVRESTQNLSLVFRESGIRCASFISPAGADAMWSKQPRVLSLSLIRKSPAATFRLVEPNAPDLTGPSLTASSGSSVALASVKSEYLPLVKEACARYGVDPQLVTALIHTESRFQPRAKSPKGALGLMQIMPSTAARYGVTNPRSLLNPSVNIDVGTRYLRDLHELFPGRVDLVLAAYNAGEGAVIKRGHRIPPFPETQTYVRTILRMVGLTS
jgi:soluble lytic murein transglycosylase-like protein